MQLQKKAAFLRPLITQTAHQATISTIATTESKVTTPTIRYSLITQTPHQATGWLTMLSVCLRHAADHTSLNLVSTATPMVRQFPLMGTNGH